MLLCLKDVWYIQFTVVNNLHCIFATHSGNKVGLLQISMLHNTQQLGITGLQVLASASSATHTWYMLTLTTVAELMVVSSNSA